MHVVKNNITRPRFGSKSFKSPIVRTYANLQVDLSFDSYFLGLGESRRTVDSKSIDHTVESPSKSDLRLSRFMFDNRKFSYFFVPTNIIDVFFPFE